MNTQHNNSKLTIAMIGQKGIPTQYGGVEKHVQELAVRLAERPDLDVVAYTRPWYTPASMKQYKGVKLVSLFSIKSKHLDAITHTFLSIIHAALIQRADVFHIHAVGPSLLAWLPRILRPRAKVITTFHCIDRQHQKWGLIARIMLWMGEWSAMKFSHQVIAVSRTLQQYSYEVYNRSVEYIPNGISQVQNTQPSIITSKWGLESDDYIVMVARLVRHKGAHHLIKAYRTLHTDKKLVIVGGSAFTDDYVAEIEAMAANDDNIILTGNQTGETLEELFSNAYLYVLPSESEGLPISLLEGGSYGRALLASDIPANKEIVDYCGVSFKNANVDSLAAAMQALLDDPERTAELGKHARKYVLENYQWNDVADKTVQTYKEMYLEERRLMKHAVA